MVDSSHHGAFAQLLEFEARNDRVVAPPAPDKGERIYGGQYLAQGLAACHDTVGTDRLPHSLHAYFLRPGNAHAPIEFHIKRTRDGRGYSARFVSAWQEARELFQMMVSFQVPEPGDTYVAGQMPVAPPPETVVATYADFMLTDDPPGSMWSGADRPMDIRYINPPTAPRGVPVTEDQLSWMRIDDDTLDDAPRTHYAGLAYLSDSTLIDHVVLPHGRRYRDPDLDSASLDHAMWFHRAPRADAWHLFVQHVEVTGGGRGLAHGRIFDDTGRLIATCMQEGTIRWRA